MGTPAARISAADFLTPPELADRRLADDGAGRIGGLRLELVPGPDGTHLGDVYQQVPLRVLPAFRYGPDRPALLFLLNPTAGLMDGDAQLVELTARSGSRAVVTGQSATRIHPCPRGFCTQQWRVRVESGAVLVLLPGPAIPFQGCHFYQRTEIELEEGAGLVWGDLWMAGRYARGEVSERFQFHTMVQDLRVRRAGTLVFRDRFGWRGPWTAEEAHWHFGDAPACGSLFVSGTIDDATVAGSGIEAAVFPTQRGDTCLRWLGSAEDVISALVGVAFAAAGRLDGRQDAWLAGLDLAPAHWFTPMALSARGNR